MKFIPHFNWIWYGLYLEMFYYGYKTSFLYLLTGIDVGFMAIDLALYF
jgi:hypothetical protein